MPMINLIQELRDQSKQSEKRASAFFFAFVGISVASAAAFGLLYLDTERLNGEEALLRKKLTKLQPLMNHIEENNKEIANLAPRLTTLTNAQLTTRRWSRILDHLTRNAPEGLWLTQMRSSQTNPAEPVTMTLTGMSKNQDSVAEFLLRLRGCSDLLDPKLKFTQGDYAGDRQGIKFELNAGVDGTAGPKPKKKEDPA